MVYCTDLYRHEIDKKAFESLNKFSALVNLQKSYMKNFDERASKINLLSTAIRLNENQMPEIYNLLPPICEKLGIPVPELYYIKSSEMNAYTYGSTNPYIVVTSKIVNKLKPNLLATVLAHECGHIACNHSLYHAIARSIAVDFGFIFLSFVSYLWVDDLEAKSKGKKSIDNSLDWFWKKI